jgi:hypothetical protein
MNHKYQLFFYLKLAGLPVSSRDIYKWRGAVGAGESSNAGETSGTVAG